MGDFLTILFDQLSETFRWFVLGYFITIALLIVLYRYQLVYHPPVFGFIKKVSYFIFLPLYIGILSWFLSATIYLEKDVIEITEYTFEETEKSILNSFLIEVAKNSSDWVNTELKTQK